MLTPGVPNNQGSSCLWSHVHLSTISPFYSAESYIILSPPPSPVNYLLLRTHRETSRSLFWLFGVPAANRETCGSIEPIVRDILSTLPFCPFPCWFSEAPGSFQTFAQTCFGNVGAAVAYAAQVVSTLYRGGVGGYYPLLPSDGVAQPDGTQARSTNARLAASSAASGLSC